MYLGPQFDLAADAFNRAIEGFVSRFDMLRLSSLALAIGLWVSMASLPLNAWGQRIQFPASNDRVMVPIPNSRTVLPSPSSNGPAGFDPYTTRQMSTPTLPGVAANPYSGSTLPQPTLPYNSSTLPQPAGNPYGQYVTPPVTPQPYGGYGYPSTGYPGYNSSVPALPGVGQSGILGTYPNPNTSIYGPSAIPNSNPSALFPGPYPQSGYQYGNPGGGGWLGNWFGGNTWNGQGGTLAPPGGLVLPQSQMPNQWGGWNPQGPMFGGSPFYPQVIRFFQGPRIRHAWIYGSNDDNSLQINDSDVALAFAIPNFLFSMQPLFLMPSFSLHQWEGPGNVAADLPALAYSAFLDAGWQSDPMAILGAELALRVGMFSDFETATSESLRIMGRGLGRVRLTPALTLKAGAVYLDRNKVKLLPAGGLLWQPNPETRFDLFFPEPKLAHYLATVGTLDTWWYVGGYYGGGAWTVKRRNGEKQSIDINDIRLVLGLEWGRNEQMRDGRRFGFIEVGYVFQRELLFKQDPADNLDLQDSVMVRAGLGY